jgi:RNA polymerase sigma-70 factor, ECF subfamily
MLASIRSDEELVSAVYYELREMAGGLLRRERRNHTLQRTALVHEAFVRLLGRGAHHTGSVEVFLRCAAHQMRLILIDYGRRRQAVKRGGDLVRVPLWESESGAPAPDEDTLLALDEALNRLGEFDFRALRVVELKFFSGHTTGETARILDLSDGTVESDWQFARSWLYGAMKEPAGPQK